jgi:hypothetical protein
MTVGSEIPRLRELYRDARATISALPDPVERELGLATLRLEATHTLKQLVTTASGLRDEEIAPLKDYVEHLDGGELPERLINTLDRQAESQAKKFLSSLWVTLRGGVAVGAVATIVGLITTFALSAQNLGAAFVAFALTGGSAAYFLVRAAHAASVVTEAAWLRSWGWATSLGQHVDRAMDEPRRLQAELWRQASAGAWTYRPFTQKGRSRARLLVGVGWALLAFGALMTAVGAIEAFNEWYRSNSAPIFQP